MAAFDRTQYSISVLPPAFSPAPLVPHASGSNGPSRFHLGEPISVDWRAPSNHSRKDWIGIYRLGANKDKLITTVSSQGRWCGVRPDEWKGDAYRGSNAEEEVASVGDSGKITFSGKKLPWHVGVYEIRSVLMERLCGVVLMRCGVDTITMRNTTLWLFRLLSKSTVSSSFPSENARLTHRLQWILLPTSMIPSPSNRLSTQSLPKLFRWTFELSPPHRTTSSLPPSRPPSSILLPSPTQTTSSSTLSTKRNISPTLSKSLSMSN